MRIHRLDPAVPLPSYQTAGAAGFDLASNVEMTIAPGAIVLIPTGLVVEVPAGHFLGIFARSSTPLKRGLIVANGVGVLDSDYCGPADELKIQVMNVTERPVTVLKGERIAQGVVLPYVRVDIEEGTGATAVSRGGFGSTG
ncbi:MAG: dUTP diphosphatase [Acidimicrobiia bacterium]|nr:dUTP diphosphatase [Acidimicrobiia bacterium]